MRHGGCSDNARTSLPGDDLLPAGFLHNGETGIWYPAVTVSWTEWLLEKGEPDSNWYDFAEKRPVWTMWWFRISAAAICTCLIWFLWLFT